MACTAPSRNKQLHARMHMIKALSTVLALLASMVAVGWGEPQSSVYSFNLTHVDANRGFSSEELMRRAVDRSRLRAETLSRLPNSDNILSRAGLSQGLAEYYMEFYIGDGTPGSTALLDTGSSLIWVTNKECSKSPTIKNLTCSDDKCPKDNSCHFNKEPICKYSTIYGGGETSEGLMCTDKLMFIPPTDEAGGKIPLDVVTFGCSDGVPAFKDDPTIGGIVGFDRGPLSLPTQLNVKKFSYCLNSYKTPLLPSRLLLGSLPDRLAFGAWGREQTTPLLRNKEKEFWYFVQLKRIRFQGGGSPETRAPIVLQSDGNEGANMFIDSGASFTTLEEEAFKQVVAKVDKIMKDKKREKKTYNDNPNCYSGGPDDSMPKMVLRFAGPAKMVLPWRSYLWYFKAGETMCLAIYKTNPELPAGMSVLGNYQQQSIHMLIDTENEQLKFVKARCNEVA